MTEEIDIKRIIDNFKQRIVLVFFITFLCCSMMVSYIIFLEKPYYESTSTLVLTRVSNNNNDNAINMNDLSINSSLVSTYKEIIKSKKILNQVIESLELDYTTKELSKMIDVTAVDDTEIISITVENRNPQLACKIANKLANIFSTEVTKIYNIENVSILDSAEIPTESANMSFVKKFTIAFVGGIIVGSTIALILAYFDTTIKTVDQIENLTGLPILGRVPNYHGKKRGRK